MNDDCLKLTTYFGERARADGGFLADAFSRIYARHELTTSIVMRGVQGFGAAQHIRTDRLLTLSEDLPLVSVAVDTPARIQAALKDVNALTFNGLVTLERARMLSSTIRTAPDVPWHAEAETKLTAYVGRHERVNGKPAYEAIVGFLNAWGVAGAAVLLGVDGTSQGVRERARFFGRNASVPLMVIAVGDSARISQAVPELSGMLSHARLTLERVQVCKRDGDQLAVPRRLPAADSSGMGIWQKLIVYSGEQAQVNGQPLYQALTRDLRHAGVAGVTSLRGIWGYHGDHAPHGDSFWQLRRRVPVLTVIVDTPERIRRSFRIVDELTRETGLVTSEMVPAYRATTPERRHGGLRLALRLPLD